MIAKLRIAFMTLGLVACGIAGSTGQAAETARRVPGTTVTMAPPAGFAAASQFAGFADPKSNASIMISELPPQAYSSLASRFDDLKTARAAFATQGITVAAIDRVPTAASSALLLSGEQRAGGVTLKKWIALLEGNKTVMITVQAPGRAPINAAAVRTLMKSIALGDVPSIDEKLASLPFAVTASQPFRVVDTIGGSGVLMTSGDKDIDPEGTQPLLIVAAQIGRSPSAGDDTATARALLSQTKNLENAAVESDRSIPFAGATGVLLEGTSGTKRFAQYFAKKPDGPFVRLVAIFPADRAGELRPAIETIAGSVAFR